MLAQPSAQLHLPALRGSLGRDLYWGDDTSIETVDNALGISILECKQVFDAFYRRIGTDGKSSGLGFTIAREAATINASWAPLPPGRYRQARQDSVPLANIPASPAV